MGLCSVEILRPGLGTAGFSALCAGGRDWGFGIADWGFAAGAREYERTQCAGGSLCRRGRGAGNVKRSQFGGPGSRRAWPALRDGRRKAGGAAGGPLASTGGPGMTNKANMPVFQAKMGATWETKPIFGPGDGRRCVGHRQAGACRCHPGAGGARAASVTGRGELGMTNKANLARVSADGAGRNRGIRSTKLEARNSKQGREADDRNAKETENEADWDQPARQTKPICGFWGRKSGVPWEPKPMFGPGGPVAIGDCGFGIWDSRRRGRGMTNKANMRVGTGHEPRATLYVFLRLRFSLRWDRTKSLIGTSATGSMAWMRPAT